MVMLENKVMCKYFLILNDFCLVLISISIFDLKLNRAILLLPKLLLNVLIRIFGNGYKILWFIGIFKEVLHDRITMQLEFALDTVSGTTSTTFDLHSFARHLLKNNKKHSILRMRLTRRARAFKVHEDD